MENFGRKMFEESEVTAAKEALKHAKETVLEFMTNSKQGKTASKKTTDATYDGFQCPDDNVSSVLGCPCNSYHTGCYEKSHHAGVSHGRKHGASKGTDESTQTRSYGCQE